MRFRTVTFLVPVLLVTAASACKSSKVKPVQSSAELGEVVARVDDVTISVGDLQERINKQSPFIRARYVSVEKKKEFLDNIIRFEVMAKEAEARGFDKDPEVIRSMKQQMISKFMQKDFESKMKVEDVPDAEVEKYYKEHPEEFNKKDEIRVSQIVAKDEGACKKALAEAKAAPKADQKVFRDLVTKYSTDEDSKARGGDMTFFDKDSSLFSSHIVGSAFKLADIGDVTECMQSLRGFHILKLTQRRPGFNRPLAEVKRQIQQRLFRDVREKAMNDFVADMKKRVKVEIYEDKLGKVLVDTGMQGGAGANASDPHGKAPAAPGAPGAPVPPPAAGGPVLAPGMAAPALPVAPAPAAPAGK